MDKLCTTYYKIINIVPAQAHLSVKSDSLLKTAGNVHKDGQERPFSACLFDSLHEKHEPRPPHGGGLLGFSGCSGAKLW